MAADRTWPIPAVNCESEAARALLASKMVVNMSLNAWVSRCVMVMVRGAFERSCARPVGAYLRLRRLAVVGLVETGLPFMSSKIPSQGEASREKMDWELHGA